MSNNIDENFERSFLESRNSLEFYATNKLSPYFEVQNQPTFLDLDEEKSRDGDILAKETFPPTLGINSNKRMVAQLILTIECKSLPDHGWIFTESKMIQRFCFFSIIRSKNDIEENLRPKNPLYNLIGTSSFLESIADMKSADKPKTNKQTNNIHDSSLKLIKLTRHLIDEDRKQAKILYRDFNNANEIVFFKIYQPLIVLNGNLYVKTIDSEKIIRANYLQFGRKYKTRAYDEDVTIHVVCSKYIQEYLNLIRSYYLIGSKYILGHQKYITERVKEDLIHWDDFNPFKFKI